MAETPNGHTEADANVFGALARPAILHPLGILYVLREDGATVGVRAPDSRGKNMFRALSGPGGDPWLLATDRGYFLTQKSTGYLLGPRDGFMAYSKVLPDYPEAFGIRGERGVDYVVWNGPEGIGCLALKPASVERLGGASRMIGLTGWKTEGQLHIAGMSPRHVAESKKHYDLSFGEAVILTVDLRAGTTAPKKVTRDISGEIAEKLGASYPNESITRAASHAQLRVESWLGVVSEGQRRVLIGAIVNPGSADWEWGEISEQLARTDTALLGLFQFRDRETELLRILYPYSFVQVLPSDRARLIYLIHWSESQGFRVGDLQYLNPQDDIPSAEPRPLTWTGVDEGDELGGFTARHDERVGYFGIVSVYRDMGRMESYLVLSDDGIAWSAAHSLGDSAYTE
jgi:hypothetical protein